MSLIETESLILRTYNLSEADKIVLMLTREHGIVRGVAKGARRLKSRFGSALEPFSVVSATYVQKEALELVSIQKLEMIDSYFAAASEPEFLQKFAYLIDILIGAVPPQDPNEKIFRMAKACLEAASQDRDVLGPLGLYFEIWLLRLTGYLPQWIGCSGCRRAFDPNEPAGLTSGHELVCENCRRISAMIQVQAEIRRMLIDALVCSPSDFASRYKTSAQVGELSILLKRIISNTLGRPVSEGPPFAVQTNRG
jgi:DNA repair protein RecO (recombination protein O)